MLVEHRTRDVVVSIDDYRRSMKLQRASPHRLFVDGAARRTALRVLLRTGLRVLRSGLRVRVRAGCERVRDRNKQNRRYRWTEVDHLRNVSPVWASLFVMRRARAAGDYFAV